MLWRALAHVDRGTYVDIGAQDPIIDSISLAFYEHGWRGIHVEPAPAYAQLLREQRPDEEVIEAVVADREGLVSFFDFRGTGLSTARPDIARKHQAAGYECRSLERTSVTLDQVLAKCGDRAIHWLKIDVEGFEREVLKGWTSRHSCPWIVVIESTEPLTKDESAAIWESLLVERGYQHAYFDGLNRFYVAQKHHALMQYFRSPPNLFDRFTLGGTATSTFCAKLNSDIAALRQRGDEVTNALLESREQQQHFRSECERISTSQREEVARARGRVAQLEKELTSVGGQLRSSEHDLAETRSLLDSRIQELAKVQALASKQAGEISSVRANLNARNGELASVRVYGERLQAELAAAASEIVELTRQTHQWWTVADNLNQLLKAVRASRSWRLTAPLRRGNAVAQRWLGLLRVEDLTFLGLLRPFVRRLLVFAWTRVQGRPERRAVFARLAARFPRLYTRLRTFALAQGPRVVARIRTPGTRAAESDQPRQKGEAIRIAIYPRSVQHVHSQLMEARALEDKPATPTQRSDS